MWDSDLDTEGTSSREKTTQWLESVLQTYFTYVRRKDKSDEEKEQVPVVKIRVTEFDIGPGYDADARLSTLSDLLGIKVSFKVTLIFHFHFLDGKDGIRSYLQNFRWMMKMMRRLRAWSSKSHQTICLIVKWLIWLK